MGRGEAGKERERGDRRGIETVRRCERERYIPLEKIVSKYCNIACSFIASHGSRSPKYKSLSN